MDEILTWLPDSEPTPAAATGEPLLAADSWLVEDGRARGLDRHRLRFSAGCADAVGLSEETIAAFWQAMIPRLPRHGELFPRVELTGGRQPRLWMRVRPAPRRGTSIRVLATRHEDPRRHPRRKGPDLHTLGVLREEATKVGADDTLLVDGSGLVLESGTASLVWWEGDTLCVPHPAQNVLSGITSRLIREEATAQGIEVAQRRVTLAELDGLEVWLVNALHGIRPVTAWVGSPVEPGPADRAPRWRRWWQASAVPLDRMPVGSA
jgi:branched-subunit amino acid aminotransferase/4-amino-4-deoxychorismate lyase